MKREHSEALAALFDGERVDPAVIESALADPEAPALFAELAELRALAQEDIGRPDEAFYASMVPILQPRRVTRLWRWFGQPAIAASLLLLGGVTGYYLRSTPVPQPLTAAQTAPHPLVETPPASNAAAGGHRAIVPPARPSSATRDHGLGGPPPASLRLRFSQWQELRANAGGQPE